MDMPAERNERRAERERMIGEQLAERGIRNPAVLDAVRAVPREWFIAPDDAGLAYNDEALKSECGQTISQPFIVAAMTELLAPQPDQRILEIGAGTGYQTAVLAQLASHVFSIEWHLKLIHAASQRLERLSLKNVTLRCGDGSCGWPEEAPFDGILVAAGGPEIPAPLVEQLAPGGTLVIPVGGPTEQTLVRLRKVGGRIEREPVLACRFVKLLGRYGWRPDSSAS